jgi:hypothetical protein
MTDLFSYIFVTMLSDWPIGTIIAIILAIILLAFFLFIIYLIFIIIDSAFVPKKEGFGKIIEKNFTPESTTTSYNVALKMPTTTTDPPRWTITVEIEDKTEETSISEKKYKSLKKGDNVMVNYGIGRFSGNVYINDIG